MNNFSLKRFLGSGVIAIVMAVSAGLSNAAEVTLRFHQFLPLTSTIPAEAIEPWIEAVEKRLKRPH